MYRKRSLFAQPDFWAMSMKKENFLLVEPRNFGIGCTVRVCVCLRNLCNASTIVNRNDSIFGCGDAAACHVGVEFSIYSFLQVSVIFSKY